MKIEFKESDYGYSITLKAEGLEDASKLMRFGLNTADGVEVYPFKNGDVWAQIYYMKTDVEPSIRIERKRRKGRK